MSITLSNDKELLEALLRGEKVEKVRHAGFGDYIHLVNGMLVDKDGKPSNIYKITPSDIFQIYKDVDNEQEDI